MSRTVSQHSWQTEETGNSSSQLTLIAALKDMASCTNSSHHCINFIYGCEELRWCCRGRSVFGLLRQHGLRLFISAVRRGSRTNRQRVILIVHLRLNTISLVYISSLLGRVIGMQTHFFSVLCLDEVVLALDARHFVFYCLNALRRFAFHLLVHLSATLREGLDLQVVVHISHPCHLPREIFCRRLFFHGTDHPVQGNDTPIRIDIDA